MIITTPLSTFELPPEGDHPAYIDKIIDLGTQSNSFFGKVEDVRKLLLSCVLVGDARQKNGNLYTVTKFNTASMHPKANLRKDVEGVLGKMTASQAATFDTRCLMGLPCIVTIKHVDSGGQLRAAVDRFAPVPEGTAIAELKSKTVLFDLANPDAAVFMKLSEGVRKMIEASPEWQQHPISKNLVKSFIDSKKAPATA